MNRVLFTLRFVRHEKHRQHLVIRYSSIEGSACGLVRFVVNDHVFPFRRSSAPIAWPIGPNSVAGQYPPLWIPTRATKVASIFGSLIRTATHWAYERAQSSAGDNQYRSA